MLTVLACIEYDHDLRLVLLAGVVCAVGCYTTVNLLARARAAVDRGWLAWGCGAAIGFGAGVWSTHFIAMLAFVPGLHAGFDIALTATSLAVAIAGSLLAFTVFLRWPPGPATVVTAGVLLGGTIGAMHYVGMAALVVPGLVEYHGELVLWSIVVGIGFATAALFTHGSRAAPATALLTLAICGLHFTAMAAVTILPLAGVAPAASQIPAGLLSIAVASVCLVILLPSLGGAIFDRHLADRTEREAARLRQFAVSTFEGILFHRDDVVTDTNAAFCRMVGCAPEAVVGRAVRDLFAPESHHILAAAGREGAGVAIEVRLLDTNGLDRPVELLTRTIDQDGQVANVVVVRDLSERRAAEKRIAHLVHYDTLTGLANRLLFRDRLGQALSAAERTHQKVALLCIDLDRFKALNDLMGHPAGDQALVQVANRLAANSRDHDTVARLGGDEFAIVQPFADQADAAHLAGRLVEQICEPFQLEGHRVSLGASVGISVYPDDGRTPETLVKNADLALYRAKQDGRGTYRFFEEEMDRKLQERRRLEQDLRSALANKELLLNYQALFDSESLAITGYEALIRWDHPTRGRVAPGDFIPLAEECGLIVPLGTWVLNTACAEAASWDAPYRIAVNLSPAQFKHADLTDAVAEILARTGLDPQRLELEITEGVLINDTGQALATLRALKAQGIRIALDDFGTGYSSLNYLRCFPFDKIKIDGSFVQGLGHDESADTIVRSILALGHSLRLSVTAEGVETQQQLECLRVQCCDHVQGFLLGRPVPSSELPHLAPGSPSLEFAAD